MKKSTHEWINRIIYTLSAIICVGAILYLFKVECINLFNPQFDECIESSLTTSNLIYNTVGTSMLVIGAILTFVAFWVQFDFNRKQKEDISLERFENKYFKLLEQYVPHMNNIIMGDLKPGKASFHYMFYEFKALYYMIWHNKDIDHWINDKELNESERNEFKNQLILNVSFSFFLNGASYSAIQIIKTTIGDLPIVILEDINKTLLKKQEFSLEGRDNEIDLKVKFLMDYSERKIKLFDGHRLRLIHYYRLVYTLFDLIIQNTRIIKNDYDREFFLRFLLDQMSEHEIGLLKAFNFYTERKKICRNNKEDEPYLEEYFRYITKEYIISPTFDWKSNQFFENKN